MQSILTSFQLIVIVLFTWHVSLSIHSSIIEHLGYFYLLVIMGNDAINTHVQAHIFIFLGRISRIIGGCNGLLPGEGVLNWFPRQHRFISNTVFVIIPSYRHCGDMKKIS